MSEGGGVSLSKSAFRAPFKLTPLGVSDGGRWSDRTDKTWATASALSSVCIRGRHQLSRWRRSTADFPKWNRKWSRSSGALLRARCCLLRIAIVTPIAISATLFWNSDVIAKEQNNLSGWNDYSSPEVFCLRGWLRNEKKYPDIAKTEKMKL